MRARGVAGTGSQGVQFVRPAGRCADQAGPADLARQFLCSLLASCSLLLLLPCCSLPPSTPCSFGSLLPRFHSLSLQWLYFPASLQSAEN